MLAEAIVGAFGTEALDILETDPERLAELRGISPKRRIQSARVCAPDGAPAPDGIFDALRHRRILLCASIKFTAMAMGAVRKNPYILTEDFSAPTFEADTLALNLGFGGDSREGWKRPSCLN